jgi:hypothetical protein
MTAAISLGACTTLPKPEPVPLQLQAFQTHEFEIDQTTAIRSVMSVFQDLGYIIQSADKDVGFITATSPMRDTTGFLSILLALGGTASSSSSQTRATAVIEEVKPNLTTVRLNFVVNSRDLTNGARSEHDKPIEDPEPYRVAFDKIEDAIFVRTAARATPAAAGPTPANPNASAGPAVAGATPANAPAGTSQGARATVAASPANSAAPANSPSPVGASTSVAGATPANAATPVAAEIPGATPAPAADAPTNAATSQAAKPPPPPTINPADAVPRPPTDRRQQQHMQPSLPRPVRVIQTQP